MPDSRALSDFKGRLLFIPALIPLLPIHLSSRLFIIWMILSLVYFIAFPLQRIPFPKFLLLPIGMFLLFVISTPFAHDHANQYKYIERNLAWLAIPVTYWLLGINQRKQWHNLLFYFTCFYTMLMLYAHALTISLLYKFQEIDATSLTFFYRTYFENASGLHPAYATLFSGLCIVFCVHYFLSGNNVNIFQKGICLFVSVLHFSSTILLASRMALVATILSMLILIFSNREFIRRGLAIVALFIVVGLFFMQRTPFIHTRMSEVSKNALMMPATQTENTLSIRTGIYNCSFRLLKEHWLFGLTPGDLQENLNSCYGEIQAKDLATAAYNTHSEYLNKWLCFGLAGIGLMGAILLLPIISAWKERFILFVCFLLLMAIVLSSENMFSRQYGLFFFLIFYSPALIILNTETLKQVQTNS